MRKLRLEVCHPQPSNAAPSLFQRRCLRTALSQTAECFSSSVIPLLSLSHFTRWIWRSPQSKVRGQLSSLSTNFLSKQHLSNVLLFSRNCSCYDHRPPDISHPKIQLSIPSALPVVLRLVGPTAACLANLLLPTVEALPEPCVVSFSSWSMVVGCPHRGRSLKKNPHSILEMGFVKPPPNLKYISNRRVILCVYIYIHVYIYIYIFFFIYTHNTNQNTPHYF